MPRRSNVDRYPVLKWFAKAARARPYLWSFKAAQVSPALYAGCIVAFLPLMGVQIILALGLALVLRANLPIAVGLQAISNPLTIPVLYPIYFFLGRQTMTFFGIGREFHPIMNNLHATFLGGVIVGLLVGAILDLLYRLGARGVRTAAEHHRNAIRSSLSEAGQSTGKNIRNEDKSPGPEIPSAR